MDVRLYDHVVLCLDVPEDNLKSGDVAVLVDLIPHPSNGEMGAILEVFNALGESISVVTVPISAIKPLQANEIFTVRSLVKFEYVKIKDNIPIAPISTIDESPER